MPLIAVNETHQKQITAGINGRLKGHKFEENLALAINELEFEKITPSPNFTHIYTSNPAIQLLQYIANDRNITIFTARAYWLGGLATSNKGDVLVDHNGDTVESSKSDIVIKISCGNGEFFIGVSVKTCANKTPTNDQMFFTTATAFCDLLRRNGIDVNETALLGMRQFCGDVGFRPLDLLSSKELEDRISDPRRFFWEEIPIMAKVEWENIFTVYQANISRILFQKAYKNDKFAPDYLLHQRVRYDDFDKCPIALFSIDEIVKLSELHSAFTLQPYVIRKGTYKHDHSTHLAPRFGFIQFQRGGQKQHPTQLQFNLKAGYFNTLHASDYGT